MADLTIDEMREYVVVHADWAIPPDVVAIEHVIPDEHPCLVAASTLPHTLLEVAEAAQEHHLTCKRRKRGEQG